MRRWFRGVAGIPTQWAIGFGMNTAVRLRDGCFRGLQVRQGHERGWRERSGEAVTMRFPIAECVFWVHQSAY